MISLLDKMIFGQEGLSTAISQAFLEYEKEMNRGRRVVIRSSGVKNSLVLAKKTEMERQDSLVRN